MKIAIVSGASSGLGTEFLRSLVKDREDIEKIWVIARRADRLEKLAGEYGSDRIVPFPLDLTLYESYEAIAAKLMEEKPEVAVLVNNAGFGTLGDFDTEDIKTQAGMSTSTTVR